MNETTDTPQVNPMLGDSDMTSYFAGGTAAITGIIHAATQAAGNMAAAVAGASLAQFTSQAPGQLSTQAVGAAAQRGLEASIA